MFYAGRFLLVGARVLSVARDVIDWIPVEVLLWFCFATRTLEEAVPVLVRTVFDRTAEPGHPGGFPHPPVLCDSA